MAAMTEPVSIAADRSMLVPPGRIVKTDYVDVFKVRHACRERMAKGDVAAAFEKRPQLGENGSWPPPRGQWDGDTFVILDGRHEHLAAVMAGHTHLFVAWLE
jgi:hypothetical protein